MAKRAPAARASPGWRTRRGSRATDWGMGKARKRTTIRRE
jgi:hypothetical protein